MRFGKQEGLNNQVKRRCHDVWLKDKIDQQHLVTGMSMFDSFDENLSFDCFKGCMFMTAVPKQPRLDWFLLENVLKYPVEFLKALDITHDFQTTIISPQRFGKPMNRRGG